MAQNKKFRVGPVALTNAAADILNPKITTLTGGVGFTATQPYALLKHIRIVNKTGSNHTVSLYIGATGGSAAGTEFAFNAAAVAANSYLDWYGEVRLDSADFLSGLADANTALTFQAEGEIGFSG